MKKSILPLLLIASLLHLNLKAQTYFCPNGVVFTSGVITCDNTPYKLVFQDEFNGDFINTDLWFTYFPRWP